MGNVSRSEMFSTIQDMGNITFLSDNLSVIASPNFYQYITDAFFHSMI